MACAYPSQISKPGPEDNRKASSMQGNANETKQKGLHFLLFSWPNRDFSKGCGRKNKKILFALNSP
jgi:hypothetical protein